MRGERRRVMAAADRYLAEAPRTVTAFPAARSPAGPHDYYSEADYWWPDPADPSGPYVRRDGYSNPDKFTAHRDALIRLSVLAPALAAAWRLTGEERYARHAAAHMRAWFVAPETRMTPDLEHAQAILGVNTGRGIGIIDTLHLVEVARSAQLLIAGGAVESADAAGVRDWFAAYLEWMTTSEKGRDERDEENNHGSCWALQAAAFAALVDRRDVTASLRERFRTVLIPGQIAPDGSQPLELARTKPYSYSLFNMDVLAALAWVLSTPGEDLWRFRTPAGAGIGSAVAFMAPYVADKAAWPYPPDVEYFDDLPVRQPAFLFAGLALNRPDWIELWSGLDPDPVTPEIVRNFPIRQPVLWLPTAS